MLEFDDRVIQIPGENHNRNKEEIEDVVYKRKTEKVTFWGMADGQSRKKYCKLGGEAVLKDLADYIENKGIGHLADRIYMDEIQYEMIRIIRKRIDGLAEKYQVQKEEFSSTLIICAVDNTTGEFMITHLGDGCVVGVNDKEEVRMISAPENGITVKYTWLTTSENAFSHLRVMFGNIRRHEKIYIMSDGADCICYAKNILHDGKKLLEKGDEELIYRYILSNKPKDDATCIVIKKTV